MLEERLRETRELLELKGKDVAKTLGVSSKTIYGYEKDYDTIPLRNLIKYANEYSFSLDYLFGLTNKNVPYEPIKIDLKALGQNLTKLRIKNNLSQTYITNKLNIASGAYSHYENGKYLCTVKCLKGLIKIYDKISIDQLFNRVKANKNTKTN